METKKCKNCLKNKPLDSFFKHGKGYYQSYCKICKTDLSKKDNENCLYQILNNGKVIYIGITENFKKRKSNHKSHLKHHQTFNGSKIADPILLEEVNKWVWEVILKDDNYFKLKVKEIELIVQHKPRFNSPYREYYEQSLAI
jgi:predicted GIY-YIG superfamily endonuclease